MDHQEKEEIKKTINRENAQRLLENQIILENKMNQLIEDSNRLKNTVAILQSELATTKALVGHTQGRGMGATIPGG